MPILEGIDGKNKMSKSLHNYIGVSESADVMYRKLMQIPDNLIVKYFQLITDIHPDEIEKIKEKLQSKEVNPRDIKMQLAKEVVSLYFGNEDADSAEKNFISVFRKKQLPEEIPEVNVLLDENIIEVITKAQLSSSKSDARRLVSQGGVKVNGHKVLHSNDLKLKDGDVIQVGKGKFVRAIIH